MAMNKVILTLLLLRRTTYDQGNKVGLHLVRQLRQKLESRCKGKIQSIAGPMLTVEQDKLEAFHNFYASLYYLHALLKDTK